MPGSGCSLVETTRMKKFATKRLTLRFPNLEDAFELKQFDSRNKSHLARWETTASSLFSDNFYKKRLEDWILEEEAGRAIRFLLFRKEDPQQIIGFCNFTQIFHGPFQACYLGYKIDEKYEGIGLMYEALQIVIQYVFKEIKLHRIMANYIPTNVRSANLLNRLGFHIEGYAKDYLYINDKWEDHVLTALTSDQWKSQKTLCSNSMSNGLKIRQASRKDLEAIVILLAEDKLGQSREKLSNPIELPYIKAFIDICSDPKSELIVAELNHSIVGVLQVTYITHLTFQGDCVAHIEGVRISQQHRGKGLGKELFQWVIDRAKSQGCNRVQLMTDKQRDEALHFYESLGFIPSHEGMKLFL